MNTSIDHPPSARVSCDKLKELCALEGYHFEIHWRWNGRNRDGVLYVCDADAVLVRVQYGRNTWAWGPGDEGLERTRTASPKHRAVLQAVQELQELIHATPVVQ